MKTFFKATQESLFTKLTTDGKNLKLCFRLNITFVSGKDHPILGCPSLDSFRKNGNDIIVITFSIREKSSGPRANLA